MNYQQLFSSIIIIGDYCQKHECNLQCDFFIVGYGCTLMSGKSPSKWSVPATIIKGMNCEELKPVVIEEEQDDKL